MSVLNVLYVLISPWSIIILCQTLCDRIERVVKSARTLFVYGAATISCFLQCVGRNQLFSFMFAVYLRGIGMILDVVGASSWLLSVIEQVVLRVAGGSQWVPL